MATYVLTIKITEDIEITVGKLGRIHLTKGLYCYIGSARRVLDKRIKRHITRQKKLHWHIDYILNSSESQIKDIWVNDYDPECYTAKRLLQSLTVCIVRKGLGSSDCKCSAHFYRILDSAFVIGNFFKANCFKQWKLLNKNSMD
jgi:sugar fermentation stimulation protein A